MLLGYELKKQTGMRLTAAVFVLCFLLVFAAGYLREAEDEEKLPVAGDVLAKLHSGYSEDPSETEKYYAELQAYRRSQAKVEKEAKAAGVEFIETRASEWTDGLYTDDIKIIKLLQETARKNALFGSETEKIILNSELNTEEFLKIGYSPDSYEVRYQEKARELYGTVLENVSLSAEYVSGWDTLYGFSLPGILSAVIAVLVGVSAFSFEPDTGMMPIIHSAKHGRRRTAAAKIASAFIISAACTVILTLGAAAAIAAAGGFFGGSEPLQALPDFRKSYIICSVRGYFLLFLGQRILGALAFSCVSLMFSALFLNGILAFSASAAFAGINFLLYSKGRAGIPGAAACLNIFALSDGERLCLRFGACNIAGIPAKYSLCSPVLAAAAVIISGILASAVWSAKKSALDFNPLKKAEKMLSGFIGRIKLRIADFVGKKTGIGISLRPIRSFSLTFAEIFKFISLSAAGVLSLVLLISGPPVYSRRPELSGFSGYTDTLYLMLTDQYKGEWSEEKHREITAKYNENDETMRNFAVLSQKFADGLVTRDEFIAGMEKNSEATRDKNAIQAIYERSLYLKKLYEETGTAGAFLDDRGWTAFLERGTQWLLYASVIIAMTPSVAVEFAGQGFYKILRTTKNGRRRVFLSKITAAVSLGILFPLFSELLQLLITVRRVGMELAASPAQSLPFLSRLAPDMSLAGYTAAYIAVRVFACLLLSLLTFGLSGVIRKPFPVMSLAVLVTLLPALLAYCGVEAAGRLDFLKLLDAGEFLTGSVPAAGGSGFDRPMICAVFIAVTVLSVAVSCRRFCKKGG